MDNRYRTTGMLSGWRLDIKTGESIPFEQSVLALLASASAMELSADNFKTEVFESGKNAFVKFLAPW